MFVLEDEELKEILRNQLSLLVEKSKDETISANELCQLTTVMVALTLQLNSLL